MQKITSFFQLSLVIGACNFLSMGSCLAQSIRESIVSDDNLTNVWEDGTIDGGAIRGKNLFHSFQKFNVPTGKTANFFPKAEIKTIFSRVTGQDPSTILGTLQVTGNANLFFLNPRGIVFGKDASLDINGAFVATTANTIKFGNGAEFSTINPQQAPLLKVETGVPIGLEFVGGSPGAIINAGNLLSKTPKNDNRITGNISLVAGTIVNTGTIRTLDIEETFEGNGSISLVTVPTNFNSKVNVNDSGIVAPRITTSPVTTTEVTGLPLNKLASVQDFPRDLKTLIQTQKIESGDIFVAGSDSGDSFTLVTGDRGSLFLDSSQNITLNNAWVISVLNTNAKSNINLLAKENINLTNAKIEANEGSVSSIYLTANNIHLNAKNPAIHDNYITTNYVEGGKNGNIKLTATNQIKLTGEAEISTSNAAEAGISGNITLDADSLILLDRGSTIFSGNIFDGTIPGNIELISPQIDLKEESNIFTNAEKANNRGNISIEVDRLSLDNESRIAPFGNLKITSTLNNLNVVENNISLKNGSMLLIEPSASNQANIDITTGTLSIDRGSLVLTRQGGDITIDAKNVVVISGRNEYESSRLGTDNIILPEGVEPGNLKITTNKLLLQDSGKISTEAASSFATEAGDITINANSVYLDRGEITANAIGEGNSGAISIYAKDFIELDDSKIFSTVVPNEGSLGNPGKIFIESPYLRLVNGSLISTEVSSGLIANNPGSIDIAATNLDLNNSRIEASTSGKGDAGDINIVLGNNLNLENNSSISTIVNSGANGQGGKIDISGTNLNLNNSRIEASTSGKGYAGDINIVLGNSLNLENNSSISTSVNDTGIGKGGEIEISAATLNITGGSKIETTTEPTQAIFKNQESINFDAGYIILKIADNIFLDGAGSGLFANTKENSVGNGGNIVIDPENFIIQNDAGIFVSSAGSGKAGNIEVFAGNLTLDRGIISANTFSSDGGNINLNIPQLLLLKNGSRISASAGTIQSGGNGGSITINSGFVVANILEDSDILANAFTGSGGTIRINAKGVFGFQTQENFKFMLDNNALENPTPGISEIVASSQFGSQGKIEVNAIPIDPLPTLDSLLKDTVNVQITQGCNTRYSPAKAAYFYLGRTGLPNNPDRLSGEEFIPSWTSWSDLDNNSQSRDHTNSIHQTTTSSTEDRVSVNLPCQQDD